MSEGSGGFLVSFKEFYRIERLQYLYPFMNTMYWKPVEYLKSGPPMMSELFTCFGFLRNYFLNFKTLV